MDIMNNVFYQLITVEKFLTFSICIATFSCILLILDFAFKSFDTDIILLKSRKIVISVSVISICFTLLSMCIPNNKEMIYILSSNKTLDIISKDSTIKNQDELRGKVLRILEEESSKLTQK